MCCANPSLDFGLFLLFACCVFVFTFDCFCVMVVWAPRFGGLILVLWFGVVFTVSLWGFGLTGSGAYLFWVCLLFCFLF